MKKILKSLTLAAVLLGLVSCNPETYKKINYLQDIHGDTSMSMKVNRGIIIQPQDQLSIIVTSRDPKMAIPFNLSVSNFYTGSELASSGGSSQRITGYVVNNEGNINFPSLGSLHAAGLNRWELQDLIKDRLAEEGLLKDAVVTVEFLNFKVSVLGEVASPGTYSVTGDKITEQNGKRQIYTLDLTNSGIFDSPAYYLQQNDVVYVTPSKVRAGQGEINENYFKSGSFWISLASISATMATLIINIARYSK